MISKIGAAMVAAAAIILYNMFKKRIFLLYKMLSTKRDSTGLNNINGAFQGSNSEALPTPSLVHSNSLSLPPVEYEVFLSFRGPDTRGLFTDILYRFLRQSKIHTFRDDDELRKGEGIWPNLVKAIHQSKIYVPIISEGYASSKWCLKELVEIVQRQKEDNRRIIVPIFYMVDPRDVRHQTGPYRDAFRQHAEHFDESTIQRWRDALSVVGTLKGWHVKNSDEVGAIVDQVYEIVWSHLSKDNYTLDTDELVGIDDYVEAVKESLSLDSGGVAMVGLHGIGGIGKTTLAKAVYNKISSRFDRCCFVERIREDQGKKDGNVTLQKKLVSDILKTDSIGFTDDNEGRKMIRERVSKHKVLVVLDDVDENFKFEDLFGSSKDFVSGSRFIVTSRNIKVLSILNDNHCKLHEVGAMDHSRSLELFCKHAFKKNDPPPDYKNLTDKIVLTTGGLPLTLKIIGSLLSTEGVEFWEEKLLQLQETPELQVMERLKISYDTLSHEAKQIFLDVACFFVGTNKQMPCYMWSDCKYYPTINLNILIQRSMMKVGDDNKFQMHDQLRDMGREIVRRESINHPWMRSRIWSDNDALEALSNKKETNQVQAIRINSSSIVMDELKSDCFKNLSELRYFEAKSTMLTGDFSNLLPNLRFLRLPEHKNAGGSVTNFYMNSLVVLDLQESSIKDNWGGWSHIKMAKKLKVLNLAGCSNLEKFPIFPESGSLEILDLSSVAEWSKELQGLDIERLKKLNVLRLKRCRASKIIGGSIGMIKGLRELDLTGFSFECENLREALIDIGELPTLEILRQSIWSRSGLSQEKIVAGIELPISLRELETSSPIPNLSAMVNLENLEVRYCRHGVDIPPSSSLWWKLSKLKSLSLRDTKLNSSSPSHCMLPSSLNTLEINNCRDLVWLPNLENLENLSHLSIRDSRGPAEIQGFGGLRSMQYLEIERAYGLTRIRGLEYLMSHPSDCKLQKLKIHHCYTLTGEPSDAIRDGDEAILESLQEVTIYGCDSPMVGEIIRNMWKFPKLKRLDLGYSRAVHKDDLEGLSCLEELQQLRLRDLWSIERVPSLSRLQKLSYIYIDNLSSLREIEGLGDLKSLRILSVTLCASLERSSLFECLKSLKNLKNLKEVDLRKSTRLSDEEISAIKACLPRAEIQWPHEPFEDDAFYM